MSVSASWEKRNLQKWLHIYSAAGDVAQCIQWRSIFLTTYFLLKCWYSLTKISISSCCDSLLVGYWIIRSKQVLFFSSIVSFVVTDQLAVLCIRVQLCAGAHFWCSFPNFADKKLLGGTEALGGKVYKAWQPGNCDYLWQLLSPPWGLRASTMALPQTRVALGSSLILQPLSTRRIVSLSH